MAVKLSTPFGSIVQSSLGSVYPVKLPDGENSDKKQYLLYAEFVDKQLNIRFISANHMRRTAIRVRIIFFFLCVLTSGISSGQNEWNVPWINIGDSLDLDEDAMVHLTGRVINGNTNEPLSGSSISVESFKHFDYTDSRGAYYLDLLPGAYRIKIKHVGMLPVYKRVRILTSGTLDVVMTEGVVELNEIVITSRPIDSNVKETLSGLTKLNIQEVKTLPTLMGEVDIVKTLQLMPGVTSVGEGSSGLNVRGGRTDQNLVLMNDVPLFNISHALGFVSAVNQDIIENFSLYKGNVPANFGGRASSVLEINTRRGNFEKWKFQGGAGPITSRLTAEGPLDSTHTSVLFAGRISHANWVLDKISDPDVSRSKLSFYDVFAQLSHRFSENSSADLNVYASSDKFQFSNQFGFSWDNYIVQGKWQGLANRAVSPVVNISYGHFKTSLFDPSGVDASENNNILNYLQTKALANYLVDDTHSVVAGVSAIGYLPQPERRQGYDGNRAIARKSVEKNNGLELAIFVNDDFQISEKFSVSLGLRYSQYFHIGPDTLFSYIDGVRRSVSTIRDTAYYNNFDVIKSYGGFEPRISARFSITPEQSVKLSYNRMRQYIHQVSNTTAPTPIDIWQVSNVFLPPQLADNFTIGYFRNLNDNRWETSFEIFGKTMKNLVEYKDFPSLFLNSHLETELLSGEGRAYGAEVYVRKMKGKLTGWLAYTYSETQVKVSSTTQGESINSGKWFDSNYSKPHNVNLVMNRSIRGDGAFSIIISYNTGRPFTAIESSYIVNDIVVPVYSERNKYRIPDYFRFDFSLTIGQIARKVNDSLVFSVYNVFGRENAYSVFYQRPAMNYFIPKPYKLSVLGAAFPSISYQISF
jgi:hypothetical protein